MRTPASVAALAFAALTSQLPAQGARGSSLAPPPRFTDPARVAKLRTALPEVDRLVREFAQRTRVPGYALGIVVDGQLLHVTTGGVRETARNSAVDTATVFRIASMTKSFTALAILKLRDEGRLSLDDPAERHVPELAGLRYPTADAPRITIRHLLTHSAGFPEDNPWGDQQLAATDAEMAAMMRAGIPFSNAPGITYEYSNFGFAILGRIVANVSGQPYARYLREQILVPLGMHSTTLEARDVPAARLAHGYRLQDGAWLDEPPLPDGAFGAMGGMLTSVGDLGKYVGFLLDAWPARDGAERGPVRRASVREMQQVWRYNGGTAVRSASAGAPALNAGGYGYGLGVRQTCDFRAIVAHSGGLPGYGSVMRWLPEQGVGIVAMGNLTYTGWGGVTDQIFAALRATGGLEAREPQPSPVLLEMRESVSRLVASWNNALADSVAAMNLYLDESKERRRAAIANVVNAAGGACRNDGAFVVENALRGRWRMSCGSGAIAVTITLAPTEPARVQHLSVAPLQPNASLLPNPVCR